MSRVRTLRTRSLTMKLTEDEYQRIAALATGEETVTHMARAALLRALAPDPFEAILLGEILVVRWLLMNFPLVDRATMGELATKCDAYKRKGVRDVLGSLL